MYRKSILFVVPDYHCSFIYRDQLEQIGWKVGIFVPADYPDQLLYDNTRILRPKKLKGSGFLASGINALVTFVYFNTMSLRFKYQIHYGSLDTGPTIERQLTRAQIAHSSFFLSLSIAKLFRKKVVYVPSGCRDEETRTVFSQLDNGNVCGNCGYSDRCSDLNIVPNLERVQRYSDLVIGNGFFDSSQLRSEHFKYKVIDLERWKARDSDPVIENKIRILHSHAIETRSNNDLNIKGSPFVIDAMNRLVEEYKNVEFVNVSGVNSAEMLRLQQESDIIVDQLIYGHWGSTGIEALALGKTLVCYVRPGWAEFFLEKFPEYVEIPVVQATADSIYEVLRDLIEDKSKREKMSENARSFAEKHYNPKSNTDALVKLLVTI